MRCVSYTRTTSCRDAGEIPADIIQQQNLHIQNYLKSHGWRLDGKYSDRKKSQDENAAFETMVQDGISRRFDMLIVDSLDRCGRSISCAEDVLVKTFFPAGIHFAVVQDDFCSTGKTMEETAAYVKQKRQLFSIDHMHAYTRQQQLMGYLSVHDEKYGYILSDDQKELLVDEEAAVVVREIFQMVIEGMSYTRIKDVLNSCEVEPPMLHMARVGKKNWAGTEAKWAAGSVKRVTSTTAYAGYWNKTINGEVQTLSITPILEPGIFEKAQEAIRGRTTTKNNTTSAAGVFARRIFDRESGAKLYQRNFKTGVSAFVKEAQIASLPRNKNRYILLETVMAAARNAVAEEMELAERVMQRLDSDAAEEIRRDALERCSRQAGVVFQEMAAVEQERIPLYRKLEAGEISAEAYSEEKARIQQQLVLYDNDFRAVMDSFEEAQKAYSSQNPWLQAFAKTELPDSLSYEQVKQRIERVEVSHFDTVEVFMTQQGWKERFPQAWLEGGADHGEKEQEE